MQVRPILTDKTALNRNRIMPKVRSRMDPASTSGLMATRPFDFRNGNWAERPELAGGTPTDSDEAPKMLHLTDLL